MKKARKNWDSLHAVLSAIESCGKYIILRNFEELSCDDFSNSCYMDGDDDIDFLCEDAAKVRRILDVKKDSYWNSHNHCFVQIQGKEVKIGLHYLGDGYYPFAWGKKMLDDRVFLPGGFYAPCAEDYFYSLLFHALLQKKKFSDDYRARLREMGKSFGMSFSEDEAFYSVLFEYMRTKNFLAEIPRDLSTSFNYRNLPKELLNENMCLRVRAKLWKALARRMRRLLNYLRKLNG